MPLRRGCQQRTAPWILPRKKYHDAVLRTGTNASRCTLSIATHRLLAGSAHLRISPQQANDLWNVCSEPEYGVGGHRQEIQIVDTRLVPELNGSFDAIGADERIRVVLSDREEIVLRNQIFTRIVCIQTGNRLACVTMSGKEVCRDR